MRGSQLSSSLHSVSAQYSPRLYAIGTAEETFLRHFLTLLRPDNPLRRTLRLYRPCAEILGGIWKFPSAYPVEADLVHCSSTSESPPRVKCGRRTDRLGMPLVPPDARPSFGEIFCLGPIFPSRHAHTRPGSDRCTRDVKFPGQPQRAHFFAWYTPVRAASPPQVAHPVNSGFFVSMPTSRPFSVPT